jgi:DNA-binding response OmpR family regulator
MQPITWGGEKPIMRGSRGELRAALGPLRFATDGIYTATRQRPESKTIRLPIVMLSAKAREVDSDIGRSRGADIYLIKAMDPSALAVQVGTLLEEERRDG